MKLRKVLKLLLKQKTHTLDKVSEDNQSTIKGGVILHDHNTGDCGTFVYGEQIVRGLLFRCKIPKQLRKMCREAYPDMPNHKQVRQFLFTNRYLGTYDWKASNIGCLHLTLNNSTFCTIVFNAKPKKDVKLTVEKDDMTTVVGLKLFKDGFSVEICVNEKNERFVRVSQTTNEVTNIVVPLDVWAQMLSWLNSAPNANYLSRLTS